jgi:hypothetical protein
MGKNVAAELPRDSDNATIQTMQPVEGTVVNFVLAATTNPHALPTGSEIVEVAVTGNAQFAFGTSSGVSAVGSGARVLTPGVYIYRVPVVNGTLYTYFDAVTVDGSSGRVTVTRMV